MDEFWDGLIVTNYKDQRLVCEAIAALIGIAANRGHCLLSSLHTKVRVIRNQAERM